MERIFTALMGAVLGKCGPRHRSVQRPLRISRYGTVFEFADKLYFIFLTPVSEHFECVGLVMFLRTISSLRRPFHHLASIAAKSPSLIAVSAGIYVIIESVFDSGADTEFYTGIKFL